jgi:hypothetical protein
MAKQETVLKALVASPGDVNEERKVILDVIEEINLIWSKEKNIRLVPLVWEKHSYPDIGEDPQDVINKQFQNDYDFFIGILWSRFGTPTKRADSGTEEEFNQAFQRYLKDSSSLKIMLYFKNKPIAIEDIDPEQLKLIKRFKADIKEKKVFYWDFDDIEDFKKIVRRHLELHLTDWGKTWGIQKENNNIIRDKETNAENKGFIYFSEEDGFIDIYEKGMKESKKLTSSTIRINEAIQNYITIQDEIRQRYHKNTSEKLPASMKIMKEFANKTAVNMDDFRKIIASELPSLQKSSKIYIDALRHMAIFINEFRGSDSKAIESSLSLILNLKSNFELLIPKIEYVITIFGNHKRVTTKFNKSKKELIFVLGEFDKTVKNITTTSSVIEDDLRKRLEKLN